MEGGIVVGIRKRIRLDTLVPCQHIPFALYCRSRISQRPLQQVGIGAALEVTTDTRLRSAAVVDDTDGGATEHFAFVIRQIANEIAVETESVATSDTRIPTRVQVQQLELGRQTDILRLRRVSRIGRIKCDVTQQHERIAALHESRTRPVGIATVGTRVQRARIRYPTGDVLEVIVSDGTAHTILCIELPLCADLRAEEPLVLAGQFVLAAARAAVG